MLHIMINKQKTIYLNTLWVLPLMLFAVQEAWGHPHAFVETAVTVVFDEKGLAGFEQRWVLDEMVSASVLDLIQEDGDGTLSPEEVQTIEETSFTVLKEYKYFTTVSLNDELFRIKQAVDFDAQLSDGKLTYFFFMPCHIAAGKEYKEALLAVYDETFYTYIAYVSEGSKSIDPTADPLFSNPAMPANPNDFKRFSDAVGLKEFSGDVRVKGHTGSFTFEAEVKPAPSLTYFHGQIIPDAYSVRFKKK